jgi:hypothetical protein
MAAKRQEYFNVCPQGVRICRKRIQVFEPSDRHSPVSRHCGNLSSIYISLLRQKKHTGTACRFDPLRQLLSRLVGILSGKHRMGSRRCDLQKQRSERRLFREADPRFEWNCRQSGHEYRSIDRGKGEIHNAHISDFRLLVLVFFRKRNYRSGIQDYRQKIIMM